MKSSAPESKPFQSRSKGETPGRARRKERLSSSKLKQAFLIDRGFSALARLYHGLERPTKTAMLRRLNGCQFFHAFYRCNGYGVLVFILHFSFIIITFSHADILAQAVLDMIQLAFLCILAILLGKLFGHFIIV